MSIERNAPQSVPTPEPPATEQGAGVTDAQAVLALVGLDPVATLITFDVLRGGWALMLNDVTMDTVYKAMQGLSARQKTTADNIANVETPGFRAGTVDFESSLRSAIDTGDPTSASFITGKSAEPNGPNDNNVNLDEETVTSIDTNLKYQTMVEAMNAKFRLLKTAMEG